MDDIIEILLTTGFAVLISIVIAEAYSYFKDSIEEKRSRVKFEKELEE